MRILRGEIGVRSLRDTLERAQKDGVAIGHFNVGDWVLLKAVFASAQELKVPCGRCVRGRTGVYRSPANCGSGPEFAGGIRQPNFS
jgi:hypothetical protein